LGSSELLTAGWRGAKLCGLHRLGIRRSWAFAAQEPQIPQARENRSTLNLLHLADLNGWLGICIVWNVGLKLLDVRCEGSLKCLHEVEQKMALGQIRRLAQSEDLRRSEISNPRRSRAALRAGRRTLLNDCAFPPHRS
jgi:hypothetical protein